jgi:4-amino-4-deoxy-L-arabinose transferase-like glycosyltransferase
MLEKIRSNKGIVFILAAFLILGLAYSVINPLYEATDELRHYRFVRVIATTARLPVQGQEPCRSQSHHPPLFYAMGAATTFWIDTDSDVCLNLPENPFWNYRYWEVGVDNKNQYLHGAEEAFPWYGDALAAHLVRGLNVIIGLGVVWLTWAIARTVWPRRKGMALGAVALVAFNPMFLYMAGSINNDVIAAFSGAAVIYGCVCLLRFDEGLTWRWGLILGGLYGLALMSKFNLAAVLLIIEATLLWMAWKRRQWRQWLVVNGLLVVVAGAVAGWWFIRNLSLYGEPTGFVEVTELWGVRDPRESFGLAVSELPYAWTTLWGRFGFGQIPLPEIIYDGLLWLTTAGLVGAVVGFWRSKEKRFLIFLLALNVVLFLAVLFNYMLVSPAGPNGRFFFPGLATLAVLIAFGLGQLKEIVSASIGQKFDGPARQNMKWVWPTAFCGAMLGLAAVALFGYLGPAYARPPQIGQNETIPNPINADFDALATLLGYEISETAVQPGGYFDLTLYWQVNAQPPGNYFLFVHLIDENGALIAQRDTHPGVGRFPTSQWQPGDRFVDTIRLQLPETVYAPDSAALSVGLYAPGSFRLGITGPDGEGLGDALTLTQIQVAAKDGPYPNLQDQNFNKEIRLLGYAYDQRVVEAGDELAVTLYWEALQDNPSDYIIQLGLINERGQVLVSAYSRPMGGERPTNTWLEGETFEDTYHLLIDEEIPPGIYPIDIALFNTQNSQRQNIVGEDGHWIDNHLSLAKVPVNLRIEDGK